MSEYLGVVSQIRNADFTIKAMPVPANNETLVCVEIEQLTIMFTYERFAKFAADVAAFAKGRQ
jgi:hypothetical protein